MEVVNELNSLALNCTKDPLDCIQKVEKFNKENESVSIYSNKFSQLDYNKLLDSVFKLLLNSSFKDTLHLKLLCMLRLLSRDKGLVCSMDNAENHMTSFVEYMENAEKDSDDEKLCPVQGLMCLSNWIYHSLDIRKALVKLEFLKKILIKLQKDGFKIENFLLYQLRVLFMMTAFENDQQKIALENGGVSISFKILQTILDNLKKADSTLDETNEKFLAGVLKALFNITRAINNGSSEKIKDDCTSLVVVLREMIKFKATYHSDSLITHICHVLINLPKQSLESLCPIEEVIKHKTESFLDHPLYFQKHDMSAVILLVESLRKSIKTEPVSKMMEQTLAVLTSFCYVCRGIPYIRKYLRQELLPPLVVTEVRPEQREDLHGDIVRLMTFVDVTLKKMAADFVFVLCKENVVRLIRYCGYGNCVGYLVSRGLMNMSVVKQPDGEYSDDELSDVENEEALDVQTGAIAQPRVNPFDDLTEEEKEEEAMKLMNLIDKLKGPDSLIKPMTYDSNGKLVEFNLPNRGEESDDD